MARWLKSLVASPARLFAVFLFAGLTMIIVFWCLRQLLPPPAIRPEGVECWHRPVFLRGPGIVTRLSGFEDLAVDPVSGRVLASAHDRRKGADVGAGEGLFFLGDWLLDPPPADAGDLDAWRRAGYVRDLGPDIIPLAAPHGIALEARDGRVQIAAISRRIADGKVAAADIVVLASDGRGHWHRTHYSDPRLRTANDLTFVRNGPDSVLLVTFDRNGGKEYPGGRVGTLTFPPPGAGQWKSSAALAADPGAPAPVVEGSQADHGFSLVIGPERFHFANGIVVLPGTDLSDGSNGILVAETRGARVRMIAWPPPRRLTAGRPPDARANLRARGEPRPQGKSGRGKQFRLSGGPDNLTLDSRGRVIAALHPDLLRYGAYRYDWPPGRLGAALGLRRAASRVVRIDPESGTIETLLDIPADTKAPAFHGASVALAFRDHLILGGAREDGLLVCRFAPGILS